MENNKKNIKNNTKSKKNNKIFKQTKKNNKNKNKKIKIKQNQKKINNNKSTHIIFAKLTINISLYLCLFSISRAKLEPTVDDYHDLLRAPFFTQDMPSIIAAKSISLSCKLAENCFDQIKQTKRNKMAHYLNGNRITKQNKNKKIKYIKVIQINKGKSNLKLHLDMIKIHIQKENPGLIILSESQITRDEINLHTHFKGYQVEHKFLPGLDRARITMFIKDTIPYERVHDIEDPWISNIWLKIKTSKNGHSMFMGGYREWQHPKETGLINTGHKIKQEERFNLILRQISKAKHISPKVLLSWDSNLDMLPANNQHVRHDIKDMLEEYRTFMNNNDMCLVNSEPTRHWGQTQSSLIDHFVTNAPAHCDNVQTRHSCIADHDVVSLLFHTEAIMDQPQFMIVRKWENMNRDNLINEINSNHEMNSIFAMQSTDKIWNNMLIGLNSIINKLAPSRVIQLRSNYIPYYNEAISDAIKSSNDQLSVAIRTGAVEEWRSFRALRNIASRILNHFKTEYFTDQLNRTKTLWKTVKHITNDDNSTLPRRILFNGTCYTSVKKICEISNRFFKDKIEDIRKTFRETDLDPMRFLSFLIPEVENNFHLPEISVKETERIIKKMKCSGTTGHDAVSSRILKIIPDIISPYITFCINNSIRSAVFPEILKVSRILPISKKHKPKDCLMSYRPIHNLHTIEKIFEEWIKINMIEHIETNDILLEEHHGGLRNHSTVTAKSIIDYYAAKTLENDDMGIILSTDLSAAYDTVDHAILMAKLYYYGIRNKEHKLLQSYYKDRYTYVQIDSKQSSLQRCGDYGVVQGSKLSGLMYSLYTNEIPRLHLVLKNPGMMRMIFQKNVINTNKIEHNVTQFVDDSNSVIIFKDKDQIMEYLNMYFWLLKIYYNMNKLLINDDKTNMLVINNPRHEHTARTIQIQTDIEIIKPKDKFTILGWVVNRRCTYDDHINKISSVIHHRMHRAQELSNYMSQSMRTIFTNAHLHAVLSYGAPLMHNNTKYVSDKMHSLFMKCIRFSRGNYGFKISCEQLCKDAKKKTSSEHFFDETAKFVHKVIKYNMPISIFKKIKMPRSRPNAKLGLKLYPKNKRFKQTLINNIPEVFDMIPPELRKTKPKQFKRSLKTIRIRK